MELTPNKKRKESDKKMMNGLQRLEVLHTHTHNLTERQVCRNLIINRLQRRKSGDLNFTFLMEANNG